MRTVAPGTGALRTVLTTPATIVVTGADTPSTLEIEFTAEFAWQKAPTGSTVSTLSTPEHNPIVFTCHLLQWQTPYVCGPIHSPTNDHSSSFLTIGTCFGDTLAPKGRAEKESGQKTIIESLPRTPLGCSCELQNVATLRGERMLYEWNIKSR